MRTTINKQSLNIHFKNFLLYKLYKKKYLLNKIAFRTNSSDLEELGFHGKIKSIAERISFIEKEGILSEQMTLNKVKFNEYANIIEYENFKYSYENLVFNYDEQNNLIRVDKGSDKRFSRILLYNKENFCIKIEYLRENELIESIEFNYNSKGYLRSVIKYSPVMDEYVRHISKQRNDRSMCVQHEPDYREETHYKYDQAGKILKILSAINDDALCNVARYEYDDNNNCKKIINDGEMISIDLFYDSSNNLTEICIENFDEFFKLEEPLKRSDLIEENVSYKQIFKMYYNEANYLREMHFSGIVFIPGLFGLNDFDTFKEIDVSYLYEYDQFMNCIKIVENTSTDRRIIERLIEWF